MRPVNEMPSPSLATPPARLTWKDLTLAQRSYAKQLYIDEGWPLGEALILAKHDGGAQ